MTVHALDVPETEAIPAWLDRHVVGPHLASLVAELTAVHGDAEPQTLEQSLGDRLDAVLANGLAAAGPEGCAALLRSPRGLLELQERVVVEGGSHWDEVASSTGVDILLDGGWKRLHRSIEDDRSPAPVVRVASWRTTVLASLLTAAATVLVMLGLRDLSSDPAPAKPSGWGWNRPGALAANETRSDYLAGLADSAEEWFKKRPESAEDVAARLLQFRHGCSTLILATHEPLTDEDRTWLRGKCRAWAVKLDAHLVALEADGDPLEVRAAADETIRSLIGALRTRATTV